NADHIHGFAGRDCGEQVLDGIARLGVIAAVQLDRSAADPRLEAKAVAGNAEQRERAGHGHGTAVRGGTVADGSSGGTAAGAWRTAGPAAGPPAAGAARTGEPSASVPPASARFSSSSASTARRFRICDVSCSKNRCVR